MNNLRFRQYRHRIQQLSRKDPDQTSRQSSETVLFDQLVQVVRE